MITKSIYPKKLFAVLFFTSSILVRFSSAQISEIPNGPWTELFNGENLDEWELQGDPPWHVEDGLIKLSGGQNKTYLIWPEPLHNLELQIRYRMSSSGANSGIQVRSVCSDRSQGLPNCEGTYLLCVPQ